MPLAINFTTIIFAIILLLLMASITTMLIYNRLIRSQVRTREAWSGIEVQLSRRADLIPNLVETVKGYAAHEREVFEEVAHARSALQSARGVPAVASANDMLTQAVGRLFAVAENYPQLRASEIFMALE